MKVMKFGGSSVSTPARIVGVVDIVRQAARREKIVVVVSAFQGVTNQLLECARLAEAGDQSYELLFRELGSRHRNMVRKLHARNTRSTDSSSVGKLLHELSEVLEGIFLLRHAPARALDLIGSFGERLSALIVASHLNRYRPSRYVDARNLIVTDDNFTNAGVVFESTNPKTRAYFGRRPFNSAKLIPVVTGFIGATEDGRTTTIGRNGSDYTAAIIGAALGASSIEIWTDVDGVMSADPRVVSTAFVLPQISYEEAMELSYFGATVLHSASIAPAVAHNIPIVIKNTLNPNAPGTVVSKRSKSTDGVAKGITSVDGITLLSLRGASMVGVHGTAERLFRALATRKVNVILISQASSEHTICFAVRTPDAATARKAITHEFRYEFQHHLTSIDEKSDQTIVAVVGEGMKGTPGVSGKVFQSLGLCNINVSAIAQGGSERNISFVTDSSSKERALSVIHQAFFEKRRRLNLVVVGVGTVGTALLQQLNQQQGAIRKRGVELRVCCIANSQHTLISPHGIDLANWKTLLNRSEHKTDLHSLPGQIAALQLANTTLVDCTASMDIVEAYPLFVQTGFHVVAPNKRANVLPGRRYAELMNLFKQHHRHFMCETNVGAGLPVISTVQNLVASGDNIIKIEGILSGTLSHLFRTYDGTEPFSALVALAHRAGLTEPDPREDLSGEDVQRKLLILGRQAGWELDMKNIHTENLVPVPLRSGRFSSSFFKQLAKYDNAMKRKFETAVERGVMLRYVGTVRNKGGEAKLQEVSKDHPLARTRAGENLIMITTQRYRQTPLMIQGTGAGADVTAMGVVSDILRLAKYLPSS